MDFVLIYVSIGYLMPEKYSKYFPVHIINKLKRGSFVFRAIYTNFVVPHIDCFLAENFPFIQCDIH